MGGSESKGLNLPPTSKTAKGGDVCLQGSSLRADRYLNRINLRPFIKWGEDNKPFLKYDLENISQLKAGSAVLVLRGARPWLIPPCLLLTSQSADTCTEDAAGSEWGLCAAAGFQPEGVRSCPRGRLKAPATKYLTRVREPLCKSSRLVGVLLAVVQ